jgi:hypothetical protein
MSHSDPIIGPDVTMAQLTDEKISLANRGMEMEQQENLLADRSEQLFERENMIRFREHSLERRENAVAVNDAWLKEKDLQLAQRESELDRRENALVINQAWFEHQQMQFEHTKDLSEDLLVLEDVDRNRCYATVVVPAEYLAVASKVMIQDQDEDEGIPAIYQTVTKHVKVSDERTSVEEVICASALTDNKVRDIQRALSLHGHNAGPVDGVVGPRTMSAVKEFQKEHGLIVADYVTLETAETLGVKF